MKQLKELCQGKNVCLYGSTPSFEEGNHITRFFKQFDVVVRCNDHWVIDEGRCDILFHIGSSPRIKVSWLLQHDKMQENLKLICLWEQGAETKKMQRICYYHKYPVWTYNDETEELRRLRRWFQLRGTTPSTGLTAAYLLSQCNCKRLHITGMDLYSSSPDRVGWHKHNPLGHCHWYGMLDAYKNVELGEDLRGGMEYWEKEAAEDA